MQIAYSSLLRRADIILTAMHVMAWSAAAIGWGVNWWHEGPAPSGPAFNFAKHFIDRVDFLVNLNAQEFTIRFALLLSTLGIGEIGPVFTMGYAISLLVAGTIQWFLFGRLIRWLADRGRRRTSIVLMWSAFAWFAIAGMGWILA